MACGPPCRRIKLGKIFPDRVKVEGHEFMTFCGIAVPEKDTHVRRKFCLKIFKVDVILIMGLP